MRGALSCKNDASIASSSAPSIHSSSTGVVILLSPNLDCSPYIRSFALNLCCAYEAFDSIRRADSMVRKLAVCPIVCELLHDQTKVLHKTSAL